MSFNNNPSTCSLKAELQKQLLDLARQSIRHGLVHRVPLPIRLEEWSAELCAIRATFVTLHQHNRLRGCIGTLEAVRPLAEDISHNAFAAAFRDPRFPPVTEGEIEMLSIHLSLLTPSVPLTFTSEADLLSQIVPFEDGLILEDGQRRGTFLPAVWESLPEPYAFLQHLKMKAGLPLDYWSDTLKVSRYRTEMIG
jgi:AmmeMemoRadiSam system protein A